MTGITKVGQIAIAVSELEPAVVFYRDILGLTMLFDAPPSMAFFECGDTRLMITTLQGDERDHHSSVIYYQVSDIEAACTDLIAKGVKLDQEPSLAAKLNDHELWLAFLRDPDQNLIGIMTEKPLSQSSLNP